MEPLLTLGTSLIYEEESADAGDDSDSDEGCAKNLDCVLNVCPGGGLREGSVLDVEDLRLELKVGTSVKNIYLQLCMKCEYFYCSYKVYVYTVYILTCINVIS